MEENEIIANSLKEQAIEMFNTKAVKDKELKKTKNVDERQNRNEEGLGLNENDEVNNNSSENKDYKNKKEKKSVRIRYIIFDIFFFNIFVIIFKMIINLNFEVCYLIKNFQKKNIHKKRKISEDSDNIDYFERDMNYDYEETNKKNKKKLKKRNRDYDIEQFKDDHDDMKYGSPKDSYNNRNSDIDNNEYRREEEEEYNNSNRDEYEYQENQDFMRIKIFKI